MNYYEILEVSPNASPEVLKAAYKSLMQRYHPDKNPGNAEAVRRSALVVQAYEVLSDSSTRAAYDLELKVRLADLGNVRNKPRDMLAPASRDDTVSVAHWFLYLLAALIFLALWLVLAPSETRKESPVVEPKPAGPLLFGHQSEPVRDKGSEQPAAAAAKTIPGFMKDLTVNLQGSPESPTHVLFIPSLDIVVGSDDPDRFISFVEKYKSHISQKLAQRLVSAKYEVLNRHDGEGEHYLKQLMLESIVTDTGPSGSGAPAHYGAVDISLPDSYTVK